MENKGIESMSSFYFEPVNDTSKEQERINEFIKTYNRTVELFNKLNNGIELITMTKQEQLEFLKLGMDQKIQNLKIHIEISKMNLIDRFRH